jgi:hypothetical protein
VSISVCLGANAHGYSTGGGHLWEYLNWALGLRAIGCQVVWLERVWPDAPPEQLFPEIAALRERLRPYGLEDRLALCSWTGERLPEEIVQGCLDVDAAVEADLFLSLTYGPHGPGGFRRSALIDIDPGLLQIWVSRGWTNIDGYDAYFTVGETVGRPQARFPDAGIQWVYTPSCVALDWWEPRAVAHGAAFTTLSNWETADEWIEHDGEWYANDKRDGFLPFLDLPSRTSQPLELALCLSEHEGDESAELRQRGWRVRHGHDVASTPRSYQAYIQASLGEFSCAKPSCMRLENAWISNRTLCYLASGKPAVVQYTGPSSFLPDSAGLFRFRDLDEAARCLESVAADYDRQCRTARALAEEHFDARKVVARVVERALDVPAGRPSRAAIGTFP